jgi:hypothetical protein
MNKIWKELNSAVMESLNNDKEYLLGLFYKGSYSTLDEAILNGGFYQVPSAVHGCDLRDVRDGMLTALDCVGSLSEVHLVICIENDATDEMPESMEKYHTGGGCTAYRVTEGDVPKLFCLITDDDGGRIPESPETDNILFGLYHEDDIELGNERPQFTITGRSGLIAWYVENVGHSPDEDIGGTTPILELIGSVASHLLLRANTEVAHPSTAAELKALFPNINFEESGEAAFSCDLGEGVNTFISVMREDMCITNPFISSCGRFDVDPVEEYQIPLEAAKLMLSINRKRLQEIEPVKAAIVDMSAVDIDLLIEDAAQAAINAGCLLIQQRIKQTDGGIAGIAFSGDSGDTLANMLRNEFKRYFELEKSMHC